MDKYKYMVVEDEPLAQKLILLYMRKYPQFELVRCCRTVTEAFDILTQQKIDLLFLDINLPGTSGIDLAKMLVKPPKIIFTTAYAEYAAVSYELEAIDYLVKPFTAARFDKGIDKFLNIPAKQQLDDEKEFIFLKIKNELLKIYFADIQYIEARRDYLMVYTRHGSYLTLMTMKAIEESLPAENFIRVHRSYIVNKQVVTSVTIYKLTVADKEIPIGEKYKEQVLKTFAL